jgi:hypothetical protein
MGNFGKFTGSLSTLFIFIQWMGCLRGKKKTFLDFLAPSAPRTGGFTGEAKVSWLCQ